MRGLINDLEVLTPTRLDDALRLLADPAHAGLQPLAGGTEIMVQLNAGVLRGRSFLDVSRLSSLQRIRVEPDRVLVGAAVPYSRLMAEPMVRRRFPGLVEAARWIGAAQIQARGTLGGNIANASPAADSVPPLIVLEAIVHLASARGRRTIPLGEFFLGYKKLALARDELITTIEIPNAPRGVSHYFRKVSTRCAQAISVVVMAGLLKKDPAGKITFCRLSLGSVAPTTLRLRAVEEYVVGRKATPAVIEAARALLDEAIHPIDDIRSTGDYRRFATLNCLDQFLLDGTHTMPADWKSIA